MFALIVAYALLNARKEQFATMLMLLKNGLNSTLNKQPNAPQLTDNQFIL